MIGGLASSSGQLGMGVAFVLEDYFSNTASQVERRMNQLEANTDKITASINHSLNQLKIGAALAGVGALMLAPFVASVDKASDLSESLSKNTVVFGESVALVNKFVKDQATAYGMSALAANDALGVYGNLFTAMKMGQKDAANYSINLTKLAADLASFNNTDIQSAMDALRSGMVGETEPLKKYGIALTQVNLAQQAMSMGLIKADKEFKDLSSLDKMRVSYEVIMAQTKNAQGDFIRTGDGYANMKRKIAATMENLQTTMGGVLLPLFNKTSAAFQRLMVHINAFLSSPLGATVMRITVVFAALLVVVGLLLIAKGGLKFASYQLAGAFNATTKAAIIETIATQGLTAGLSAVAAAAWAALAPLLPFIAIAAAVAAIIWAVYKAVQYAKSNFDGLSDAIEKNAGQADNLVAKMTPVERFFAKIGGIIRGVAEIWRSWNGETFTLTEKTAKALESLGILDFVIGLGTWIVRVKEFFKGMWQGMKEGFSAVWDVLKKVGKALYDHVWIPLTGILDKIGIHIGKNTSDLNKWAEVGKYVGYVIVGILTLVALSFIAMGVSALMAMLPIIIVIGAIIAIIWGVIWVIRNWGRVWDWIKKKAGEVVDYIWAKLSEWWDWFAGLPERAYDAGVNMVQNIWEGMKSKWGEFTAWLDQKISEVPLLGEVYGGVKDMVGGSEPTPAAMPYRRQSVFDNQATMKGRMGTPVTNNYGAGGVSNFSGTFPIYMDGDKIAEKVIEKQEFNNSRKTTG